MQHLANALQHDQARAVGGPWRRRAPDAPECTSATSVSEPAALPAASTISRPRAGGSGKCGGRLRDGCATVTLYDTEIRAIHAFG